jgi:hypothetical protein
MKKLIRIGLILFGAGVLLAFGTYLYVFHKPHRNVAKEKPSYVLDAQSLFSNFKNNEDSSYIKYGDKVIQVTGNVVDITIQDNAATIVYIDPIEGISCSFDSITVAKTRDELSKIQLGDRVTIKGKCDGYDLIMGVVLTRCILINDDRVIGEN